MSTASPSYGYRLPQHFSNSALRRSSPLRGDGSGDFDKENKIRIVEKLGTMKYALTHDDSQADNANAGNWFTPHATSSGGDSGGSMLTNGPDTTTAGQTAAMAPHGLSTSALGFTPSTFATVTATGDSSSGGSLTNAFSSSWRNSPRNFSADGTIDGNGPGSAGAGGGAGGSDVKWLDDQELSEMSTEELEVLMDRYIMEVVKQLVQLAALDEDLKAEIDSLDASGFSLLHYCCLYNLNSLIPVLLARSADVNRRTATGSTALHLAAGAGNLAVVQVLVDSGAHVDICDANNVLPSDEAYQAGHMDIYNVLLSV